MLNNPKLVFAYRLLTEEDEARVGSARQSASRALLDVWRGQRRERCCALVFECPCGRVWEAERGLFTLGISIRSWARLCDRYGAHRSPARNNHSN